MSERVLLGGTDGFRGTADLHNPTMGLQNEVTHYWLTSALVSLQAEAGQEGPVIVARDTRPSGWRLVQASIHAVHDQGHEVTYLDVAPTPVAQKMAELTGAMATIAVTASHNPAGDNGWKGMLGSYKPTPTQVKTLSDRAWDMYQADGARTRDFTKLRSHSDIRANRFKRMYTDRLVSRIEQTFGELPLAGKILVYDGANGAASHMAPDILSQLGAEVRMINCGDGTINDNCGAAQEGLLSLKQTILDADLGSNPNFLGGIANDGDADRLMAVGVTKMHGEQELVEIDGNHIMYELAQGEPGIVGTIYTNSGMRTKLQAENIGFMECGNGDQYVTQALQVRADEGWRRGGEFTGHLIDTDWLNSGDGVAMAAWLSATVARQGANFGDVYRRLPLWHESMHKIRLPEGIAISADNPLFQDAQAWAVEQMAGEGRSIVRPSGTEPVVRVWIESPNQSFAERVGEVLRAKLYRELLAS